MLIGAVICYPLTKRAASRYQQSRRLRWPARAGYRPTMAVINTTRPDSERPRPGPCAVPRKLRLCSTANGPLKWTLMAIALMVVGCVDFKGGPGDGGMEPVAVWHAVPVEIRISPATRFVQEEDQFSLEARIELSDEMGDPIKVAGDFRFELLSAAESVPNVLRRRLYTWEVDLLTLEDQQQHFQTVTRSYVFRLGIENLNVAQHQTMLLVLFTPTSGQRLETLARVKADW